MVMTVLIGTVEKLAGTLTERIKVNIKIIRGGLLVFDLDWTRSTCMYITNMQMNSTPHQE